MAGAAVEEHGFELNYVAQQGHVVFCVMTGLVLEKHGKVVPVSRHPFSAFSNGLVALSMDECDLLPEGASWRENNDLLCLGELDGTEPICNIRPDGVSGVWIDDVPAAELDEDMVAQVPASLCTRRVMHLNRLTILAECHVTLPSAAVLSELAVQVGQHDFADIASNLQDQ